jgi:oligosaccharide repeat unit polymerase
MILLAFTALLLLTALNYYLGRSFFYPAFVFCATWTLSLFCLLVSGSMFFPLAPETLFIFMCGAFSFTIGCAAGKFFPLEIRPPGKQFEPKKIISLLITLLVVSFPFYLVWLLGMVADHPADFFLQSTRDSFVELVDMGPEKYTPQYVFFINLLGLASLVAIVAWLERKGRNKRAFLAAIIAILYFVSTGGRSTVIQLLLSLLCIEWLMVRRLRFKTVAAVATLILLIFGTLAVLVHTKSDEMTLGERVSVALNEFVGYTGGPLVAFDRVVREPNIVPHTPNAAVFFIETANKLGMKVEVPAHQTEFVHTGPDRRDNVFTIYFHYFDAGMPIAFFLIAVQAFLLGLAYRFALDRNKIAVMIYAYLFPCVAMTTFVDWLTATINPLLKMIAFAWFLYSFPPLKSRFARFIHGAAQEHITACERSN